MRIDQHFRRRLAAATLGLALVATACSTDDTDQGLDAAPEAAAESDVELTAATESADDTGADTVGETALFDSGVVHDIEIEFDDDDYAAIVATYETTGEKDWIEATIVIDGTTIENVGLRLKGNSSLFGLTVDTAENPEELPWLIRFDKFVDGQTYQGYGDLVIRSNSTETAMNEAVAVELLDLAGLATEEAIATMFTVNGGETELRLAMELPDDDVWVEDEFGDDDGLLYKADSSGDYSYRGDDPDAYDDVFDQKVGDDDLEPLIDFLEFINNSDDETFAAELGDRLDVEAFATYLAFQELVDNFDDIDGPGNNSYLYYDVDEDRFTVVNWDLNLAFGTMNVSGGPGAGGPGAAGGERPLPPDGAPTGGPVGGPGALGGNVLSERFLADDDFASLYADALVDLSATLYDSGAAADIVATWSAVLTEQASDLVDPSTIESEASAILASIESA